MAVKAGHSGRMKKSTSWGPWDERIEKDAECFVDSKENKWVGSQQSCKEGTVRQCQSKEASILWSHHEERREMPGERKNARINARCTHARKTVVSSTYVELRLRKPAVRILFMFLHDSSGVSADRRGRTGTAGWIRLFRNDGIDDESTLNVSVACRDVKIEFFG